MEQYSTPQVAALSENTILPDKDTKMSIDSNSEDDDNDDDDAGLGNNTLKAMQIFIFVAICGVIVFFAYKALFNDSNSKVGDRNELNIKKESSNGDTPLVDSLRTNADIFIDDENKKEEKADTSKVAVPDTTKKNDSNQETLPVEVKPTTPEQENHNESASENNKNDKPNLETPNTDNTAQTNPNNSNQGEQGKNTSTDSNTPQRVIVGSFDIQDNATNLLNELKANGQNASIVKKGDKYQVVVLGDLETLKKKYKDAWISN